MRIRFALLSTLLACGPAIASGGLECTSDGDGVSFEVNGGVSRGMGSVLFSFDARLDIRDDGIAPDLAQTKFQRDHVAQYWMDADDLRLRLYRERDGALPHGYVELVIEAVSSGGENAGSYAGRYMLSVFDMTDATGGEGIMVRREGAVGCSSE